MFALPAELLSKIARQLDVQSRLALGCTCRAAVPLVVNIALLEFRLSKKGADAFSLCCSPANRCAVSLTYNSSKSLATKFAHFPTRKKGHVMPIYEALDPACKTVTACGSEHWRAVEDGSLDTCGTASLRPGSVDGRHMLPVGMPPQCACVGWSDAVLSAMPLHAPPPHVNNVTIPRASLRASLTLLDLSRAQHVSSVAAAGLACLRVARLPPSARVVCLDGCSCLAVLTPTNGCSQLLSLRLDGCRKLSGSSFGGATWSLGQLVELDLCWCTAVDAATLASLLPTAPSLSALSLRGLRLAGVLEATLQGESLTRLSALDLSFCSELASSAVQALVAGRPQLLRCNLRAAASVTTEVYNEVGRVMLKRAGQGTADVVENRRRPKHLARRTAEPFYYLKR